MKTKILFVIGIATSMCGGCATPIPRQMDKYFDTPSQVRFAEPVYVKVIDERPEEERKGTGWSNRYISTVDGDDKGRVALVFAEDLAKLLERKRIASKVRVSKPDEDPPEGSTLVSVRLLSWYGRVRDFDKLLKTEKVAMALLDYKTPAYDNKGRCRFSAIVTRLGRQTKLEICAGDYTVTIHGGGNMQNAKVLSGAAADRAFVQFLKKFESTFSVVNNDSKKSNN